MLEPDELRPSSAAAETADVTDSEAAGPSLSTATTAARKPRARQGSPAAEPGDETQQQQQSAAPAQPQRQQPQRQQPQRQQPQRQQPQRQQPQRQQPQRQQPHRTARAQHQDSDGHNSGSGGDDGTQSSEQQEVTPRALLFAAFPQPHVPPLGPLPALRPGCTPAVTQAAPYGPHHAVAPPMICPALPTARRLDFPPAAYAPPPQLGACAVVRVPLGARVLEAEERRAAADAAAALLAQQRLRRPAARELMRLADSSGLVALSEPRVPAAPAGRRPPAGVSQPPAPKLLGARAAATPSPSASSLPPMPPPASRKRSAAGESSRARAAAASSPASSGGTATQEQRWQQQGGGSAGGARKRRQEEAVVSSAPLKKPRSQQQGARKQPAQPKEQQRRQQLPAGRINPAAAEALLAAAAAMEERSSSDTSSAPQRPPQPGKQQRAASKRPSTAAPTAPALPGASGKAPRAPPRKKATGTRPAAADATRQPAAAAAAAVAMAAAAASAPGGLIGPGAFSGRAPAFDEPLGGGRGAGPRPAAEPQGGRGPSHAGRTARTRHPSASAKPPAGPQRGVTPPTPAGAAPAPRRRESAPPPSLPPAGAAPPSPQPPVPAPRLLPLPSREMSGTFLFDVFAPPAHGLGSGGGGGGTGGVGPLAGPGLLDPASPGQRLLDLAAREEAAAALGPQQDAFLEAYQLFLEAEAGRAARGAAASPAASPPLGANRDQPQLSQPTPALQSAQSQLTPARRQAHSNREPKDAPSTADAAALADAGRQQPRELLAQPLSSAALGLLAGPAAPLRSGVAGMLLQSVAPSPATAAADTAVMEALRASSPEADAAATQRLLELALWGGAHLRCPCGADVAGAGLPRVRCVCCGVLQHAACVSAQGAAGGLPPLGAVACSRTGGGGGSGGCGTLGLGGGLEPTAAEARLVGAEELVVAAGQIAADDEFGGHHACETCRAELADPFWAVLSPLLLPPRLLRPWQRPGDLPGSPTPAPQVAGLQNFGGDFHLPDTPEVRAALAAAAAGAAGAAAAGGAAARVAAGCHRVVVACLRLGDDAPACRLRWPAHTLLKINDEAISTPLTSRPYPARRCERFAWVDVTAAARVGRNVLVLAGAEEGGFAVLVALARRRSPQEVEQLMAPSLPPAEAVRRVKSLLAEPLTAPLRAPRWNAATGGAASGGGGCAGLRLEGGTEEPRNNAAAVGNCGGSGASVAFAAGGGSAGGGGEDAAAELPPVPLLQATVSHLDPLSRRPISRPATLLNSRALQPFDLEAFLFQAATQLAWTCPVSGRATTVRHLARDSYFSAVFSAASARGGSGGGGGGGGSSSGSGSPAALGPVEVAYDGRWRPLGSGTWRAVQFPPAASPDMLASPPAPAPVFAWSAASGGGGSGSGGAAAGSAMAQQLRGAGGGAGGGAPSSMGPPIARQRPAVSPAEGDAPVEGPAHSALPQSGYTPRGVAPAAPPAPSAPLPPPAAASGAAPPGEIAAAPAAAPSTPRGPARPASEALPALTPITRQLREFASWGQRLSQAASAAGGGEFGGAAADPFASGPAAGGAGAGLFFCSPLVPPMPSLMDDGDAQGGGATPAAGRAGGGIPGLVDLLASGGRGSGSGLTPPMGQHGRRNGGADEAAAPGGSVPLPFGSGDASGFAG
ncbi:hypothetical protein Rsub_10852 [Raphidocelis subcapitata]|uniref:Uncharacterized protein n=1 Tax=Raphidocelis subcapitata TaxID=307507 RepID=A0A2V0PE43_9CHLO|nr:hypothetical protein Rsub_10852 [Raphidocelis subcapitata]|eukprot:GBF98106.1 hypothetical protein Rsub_10852 [Raphidocelis subcapitata]